MTRDFHRCSEQFSDIFSNVRRFSWVFSYVQAFSEMAIDFHRCSSVLRHFQQCSEIFSNDQIFSFLIIAVSALKIAEFLFWNNTDHGSFSSETVIFIEIHAMCINYQFWIILKNLFTSLNQSGVSMIIAESSKDVNPGGYFLPTPPLRQFHSVLRRWLFYLKLCSFYFQCRVHYLSQHKTVIQINIYKTHDCLSFALNRTVPDM